MKAAVDEALLAIAESADDLDALLEQQAYRLAYWKIGYEEINYRRFFDINELVGLRIEEAEVFENRYQQTLNLVRAGEDHGPAHRPHRRPVRSRLLPAPPGRARRRPLHRGGEDSRAAASSCRANGRWPEPPVTIS